jgi:hypothetical protein
MADYVIKQGDTLDKLAADFRLGSAKQIRNHPANAEFCRKYPDPNLLFPGEKIFIPDLQQRTESAGSDDRHQYVLKRSTQKLQIAVEDQACKRMANAAYEMNIDGVLTTGTTDGDGIISKDIPVDSESCILKIGDYRWTMAIGCLNPMHDNTPDAGISGLQGRLRNLGYPVGPLDGIMGPKTRMAIRFFQADESLPVTGEFDQVTRDKLQEVHGL